MVEAEFRYLIMPQRYDGSSLSHRSTSEIAAFAADFKIRGCTPQAQAIISIVIAASTTSLLKLARIWASRRDSAPEFLEHSHLTDRIAGLYPAVRIFTE